MVLKTAPLTKRDLEFIKTIWESLRRNQHYKNDYAKLKVEGHLLDPNKTPEFCEKWELSGPIDPDFSFDELYGPLPLEKEKAEEEITKDAKDEDEEIKKKKILKRAREKANRRIQSLFLEKYIPDSDIVYDFNLLRPSFDGKYLNIHINLSKSRNLIEAELKNILDKWLSKKSKEFHDIEKESTSRLKKDPWERRFKVFDLVHDPQKRWFYPDIAIKLGVHPKTVQRLYKEAWESIHKEPLPPKSERRKEIAIETVENICVDCENRICEKTGKLCPKVESFVKQDEIAAITSVDDSDTIMDYDSFKKWDTDRYNPDD